MLFLDRDQIAGHAWTIMPTLRHRFRPTAIPASTRWTTTVTDPVHGDIVVRGEYRHRESDTLVIALHGLGGSPDSGYLVPIALAAEEQGWSCLRLALRGADGIGGDFYHAALTDDLAVVLEAAEFARYARIFVVGFSLGGHIALTAATQAKLDPRLTAVVAVCPPIDLAAGVRYLDAPQRYVYKKYILRELLRMYWEVARHKPVPTPVSRVQQARSIQEWDALTVVPRFGFGSVDNYYATAAIAGRMDQIARPALMVHSRHDPMIPASTVDPALASASSFFEARWFHGAGHVFFPPGIDLGMGGELGLGSQVMRWLEQAAPAGGDPS